MPQPRRRRAFVHWPIVALAAVPCVLFVGIVIAVLAMVPGPRPAPARASAPLQPAAPAVALAPAVTPIDNFDAEIKIPPHHALAAVGDLPVFDAPEPPIQPVPPRNDIVPVKPEKEAKDGCFGTAVNFLPSPAEAFTAAKKEKRLVLILHVSGNFEDSGFT